MANILSLAALSEFIYAARDQVAREQVGFLPSVTINSGSQAVSLGGTVQSLRTVKPTLNTSYTPAMTIPAGDDLTPGVEEMTIGQVANVKIPWTGESALKLRNTGQGRVALTNTFAQALRTMTNAIEAHVGTVIKNGSSRAVGTAGTPPFGSDHKIINSLRQILTDNGTPFDGQNALVINSTAGVNLRNLSNLTKANEIGSTDPMRQGTILDISGFAIKESAGVASHTKGTNASAATTSADGFAAGSTTIATAAAGTGTIVTGDAINIATENNGINYIVKTGNADVSAAGSIVINQPGLKFAIGTTARAISLAASYTGNVGFHRTAVELAMRPPALPDEGDAADDRMTIFDEVSGLVFEIALYKGYGMVMYDITCFYQAKVWKPEFVATLLG
jgi:hypothetical protein